MTIAKRLLGYLVLAIVLFLISYPLHSYFLEASGKTPPYSLLSVYLFQAIASLVLVFVFELLAYTEQYNDQLGFLYMGSMVLKIVFFGIFFKSVLFSGVVLSKVDLSLIHI